MADSDLSNPVVVQASRIDASILPKGFSQAYTLYVIQQGTDVGNVANKANEASQGAADAQQRNDQQDTLINSQGLQIQTLRSDVDGHEARITNNTNDIAGLTIRVDGVEGAITAIQLDITNVKNDMVSKSAVVNQVVQASGGSLIIGVVAAPTTDKLQIGGPVNATSYKVAGLQVVSSRQGGWTAATGASLLSGFNASQTYSTGAAYSQTEAQALATGLVQARQRIKALEDMARTHGLIN